MGHPFNFYQFAESGSVSAYPSNFSGFYTPLGMLKSPDSFLFIIDNDFVHNTTYELIIRGSQDSTYPDTTSLNFSFSGSVFPIITGTANTHVKFTGQVPKHQMDSGLLDARWTGSVTGPLMDVPTFIQRVSGKMSPAKGDTFGLEVGFRGAMPSIPPDSGSYDMRWSGNFVKYERDLVSLNTSSEAISWSLGNVKKTLDLGTGSISMSADLETIFWSRAGS